MKVTRILLAGAWVSTLVCAQKREDFVALQRDVAQMQDQMKQLQRSQDEKMAALTALVQQALDTSSKLSGTVTALQRTMSDGFAEQQTKVVPPIVALGAKTDQISGDIVAVRENVASIATRMGKLDDKLTDILTGVRTLLQPPTPPPAPAGTVAPPAANAIPAGVSAGGLFSDGQSDYRSGNYELAMESFVNYLKYFPDSANAPEAQFFIGMIYDHAMQFEDAVKAFKAVVDRYPTNSRTAEAMYFIGVEYQKNKQRAEAIDAYRDFVERFPNDKDAPKARDRIRAEQAPAAKPPARKKK